MRNRSAILYCFVISIFFWGSACEKTPASTPQAFSLRIYEIALLKGKATYLSDGAAAFRLHEYYKFTIEDETKADYWLRKAAEENHGIAQYNLAYKYLYDQKSIDRAQAHEWLRRAAATDPSGPAKDYLSDDQVKALIQRANNDGTAAYRLCRYYQLLNDPLGQMWLKKSAEQGHAEAEFEYGLKFLNSDIQNAKKWIGRSAAQRYEPAIKRLSTLSERKHK